MSKNAVITKNVIELKELIIKHLIALSVAAALASCSDEVGNCSHSCGEIWKLVEMTGNIADVPPSTGADMEWQEWYTLRPDRTFSKRRERDGVVKEQGGTWTTSLQSDGKYLTLTYESENDMVGSCYSAKNEEVLKFNGAEDKLTGTWSACDGPGLTYERISSDCPDE